MSTLMMKFGGTSVGSPEALTQSAQIIMDLTEKWQHIIVVVSAMSGITDLLLKSAHTAVTNDSSDFETIIDEIKKKHTDTVEKLITDPSDRSLLLEEIDHHIIELSAICRSIQVLGEITPRGLDAIASLGERLNARVFAAILRSKGEKSQAVDATKLIVTDDNFQNAVPDMVKTREKTRANLLPLIEKGIIPVVTGFIGATEQAVTTTLGRGGSDYTSAILGDCLDVDEVWTWTDVDGVMTADPRIVSDAKVIPELSYNEVGELAYFGAKILHPKTIRPVVERGIPLWVKNTFNPSYPGTRISSNPKTIPGKITAITAIRDVSMVTVEGRGMLGVPGIAARTFAAVAREGASVLMISQSSSEQSICFVIPSKNAQAVIQSIEDEVALELMRRDIDRVWEQQNIVILTVIGSGLRNTPGVSARVFGALGKANINVFAIAQGSSEYSISLVVASSDADNAIREIHKEAIINGQ